MYNATKILLFIGIMLAFAACKDTSRTDAANQLLTDARTELQAKNYPAALALLDTLDTAYGECIDARRQGQRLRIETRIEQANDSLMLCDSILPTLQDEVARRSCDFTKIGVQGTEGYYVYSKSFTNQEMNSTGLQARVDDEGYFFVAVNLSDRKIGLNSISYAGVSSLPAQSMAIENSEIMSLSQEKVADLAQAIADARPGSLKISLNGSKGKATATLSAKQAEGFRQTWTYAHAVQKMLTLQRRQQKYERQLALLQTQLNNVQPTAVEVK